MSDRCRAGRLRAAVVAAGLALAALAGTVAVAGAHELRPALLEVVEGDAGQFAIVWKVPADGERALALEPVFPASCVPVGARTTEATSGARVQRWTIDCGAGGLSRGTIVIDGLERTLTDALLRLERRGEEPTTALLRGAAPAFALAGAARDTAAGAYLRLGVEHVLVGFDHLLLVLALVLLVGLRWRLLLKTVAAFIVAQSLTLALATLGVLRAPLAPVEAVSALGIMFVAAEILRARAGSAGLTLRMPWLVALAFGLLHGFRFAGALASVGIPRASVPLALLLFNVGVELGLLCFVALCVAVLSAARRAPLRVGTWAGPLAPYAVGCVAAYWLVQRVAGF